MVFDFLFELMTWDIVVMNSVLLFSTGCFSLLVHLYLDLGIYSRVSCLLVVIIIYSLFFLTGQFVEFCGNQFLFNSTMCCFMFYLITSLHGSHVVFGLLFIFISFRSVLYLSVLSFNWLRFSMIYWHFVDCVWIVLLVLIYDSGWSVLLDVV